MIDYEPCGECGYDHEYEPEEAYHAHKKAAKDYLEHSGEHLYASVGECKRNWAHLTVCDDDGFCCFCGEQYDASENP